MTAKIARDKIEDAVLRASSKLKEAGLTTRPRSFYTDKNLTEEQEFSPKTILVFGDLAVILEKVCHVGVNAKEFHAAHILLKHGCKLSIYSTLQKRYLYTLGLKHGDVLCLKRAVGCIEYLVLVFFLCAFKIFIKGLFRSVSHGDEQRRANTVIELFVLHARIFNEGSNIIPYLLVFFTLGVAERAELVSNLLYYMSGYL